MPRNRFQGIDFARLHRLLESGSVKRKLSRARICKRLMGPASIPRNRIPRIRFVGIDSARLHRLTTPIPGLLKRLPIRAQCCRVNISRHLYLWRIYKCFNIKRIFNKQVLHVHFFLWRTPYPAWACLEYRARICKTFIEPKSRFPTWRDGTTTLFVVRARNRFMGMDSWAHKRYKYGLCCIHAVNIWWTVTESSCSSSTYNSSIGSV